ncbi:MAG: hypothetical protein CMH61_00740 [Nanoarchaeota archaeon]|nr:hypothetical protein [Nanoarchaeota archaeon]
MKNLYNACVECEEVITHPICSECLSSRMRSFVGEHDEELSSQLVGAGIEGGTQCLLCHQPMGLCAHCFSRDVYDYLVEKNPALAEEFLSRFDFDLRRSLA